MAGTPEGERCLEGEQPEGLPARLHGAQRRALTAARRSGAGEYAGGGVGPQRTAPGSSSAAPATTAPATTPAPATSAPAATATSSDATPTGDDGDDGDDDANNNTEGIRN